MKACRWLYHTTVMVTNVLATLPLQNITQVCVQPGDNFSMYRDFRKFSASQVAFGHETRLLEQVRAL